jgi:hypothetical protein
MRPPTLVSLTYEDRTVRSRCVRGKVRDPKDQRVERALPPWRCPSPPDIREQRNIVRYVDLDQLVSWFGPQLFQ